MDLSQLIGNDAVKGYLQRMVANKAIANSLLFAGPEGIGKSLFANALAAMVLSQDDASEIHHHKVAMGNHPDLHVYQPEGKLGLHSIASLRQLCEEVYLAPYESKWKVFIIHEAERMLSYSANALLKTFEEPAPNTLIILISSAPEHLLPTVLSRCRVIHFHALPQKEILAVLRQRFALEDRILEAIVCQANGSLGRAVQLAEQGGNPGRECLLKILSEGKFRTYKALMQAVQGLNEQVEGRKKQTEEALRQELGKASMEGMSATQKQSVEKELEGLVSLRFASEVSALLMVIQSWYRDLHLLSVNGERQFLFHRDYLPALEDVSQRGALLSLEDVEKFIKETHLALQRSTPLPICLENLFLKLNLLGHPCNS